MSEPKPKVVVVKDYPARRAIASFLSLPMFFVFSLVLGIPFVILGGGTMDLGAGLALTIAAEIAVIIWGLRWTGLAKDWKSTLFLDNFKWWHVALGAGLGVVLFFGLQLFAYIMSLFGLEMDSSDTSNSLGALTGWQYVVIYIIAVPIIIPLVEELFFRGYILGTLQKANKKFQVFWVGILTSSVYFAIAHFQGLSTATDVGLLLWIGGMAALYAFLTLKTRSLYVSYFSHLAYNGTTVLISIIGSGLS